MPTRTRTPRTITIAARVCPSYQKRPGIAERYNIQHGFVDVIVDKAAFEALGCTSVRVKANRDTKLYAYCYIDGKEKALHRVLLKARRGRHVHHENNNTLDNRVSNLVQMTPGKHAKITSQRKAA